MPLTRRPLLAATLGAVLPAHASTLRVLGDHYYPPFCELADGKPVGLLIDGLHRAGKRLNQAFQVELTVWRRALHEVQTHEAAGLIGVSYNDERASWLDYSEPIEVDRIYLVSLRSRPHHAESLADLRGLHIGVGNGISHGQAFEAAVASGLFRVSRDWGSVVRLRMLLTGRLDAVMVPGGLKGIQAQIDVEPTLRAQRDAFLISPRALIEDHLHLAFPKRMQQRRLLQRLAAAWPGP
jgi:polar amino acid transport system substrate-binding protein